MSSFDRAIFLKPRPAQIEPALQALAPLIAIRIPDKMDKSVASLLPRPAESAFPASTQPEREQNKPTVFFLEDADRLGTESRPRKTFLWYSRNNEAFDWVDSVAAPIPYVAVSVTLDRTGAPMIVRVRGSAVDQYYVTESLEAEARRQFGLPLTEGGFSIERPFSERSEKKAVVPRLLASGPEPSGPWVYMDGENFLVTTVICRCSQSQVRSITETHEYDLMPASKIPGGIAVPDLTQPSADYLRLPTAIP